MLSAFFFSLLIHMVICAWYLTNLKPRLLTLLELEHTATRSEIMFVPREFRNSNYGYFFIPTSQYCSPMKLEKSFYLLRCFIFYNNLPPNIHSNQHCNNYWHSIQCKLRILGQFYKLAAQARQWFAYYL